MKENQQIKKLFGKYVNESITKEELAQFATLVEQTAQQDSLDCLLEDHFVAESDSSAELISSAEHVQNRAWIKIQRKTYKPARKIYSLLWPKIAVAATLLLTVSVVLYYKNSERVRAENRIAAFKDINPGSSRATLIAEDGTKVELNGSKHEIVVDRQKIRYSDGEVVVNPQSIGNLILSTPKGGQFRIILSDGTKVWLNAASSLTYPTNFTGNQRKVQLKGEAYFEVSHNPDKPFIVSTEQQQVKVLGTSFNLNAYADESQTVTTLLNGRVELSGSDPFSTSELHPGEQAVFKNSAFDIKSVDASMYAAWKEGEFRFNATPLASVLRQIERWYDLDVDYTGIPADIAIHASINRNKQLSSVLHALEKITDLKFEVKGRSLKLMQ